MTFQESASSAESNGSANRGRYWRSLAELEQSEDFKQFLHREFPVAASEFPEGVSRRRWLQLMGASLAVAGVTGCRYPEESIAPFVLRPEGRVPGEPYHRATNFELAGRVYNLLIECIDGRPIKIEPNTDHPSGGGTDPYIQASVLGLYDPDRARRGEDGSLLRRQEDGRPDGATWEDFDVYARELIQQAAGNNGGAGFAVVTPPTASPSVVRMVNQFKQRLPNSTVVRYDGVFDGVMREATEQVFGTPARQTLELSDAEVIVAIQADILGNDPGFVRNARGFSQKRNPIEGNMSRLYMVEGGYSQTGATADTRLALRPGQMPAFIAELQRRVDELLAGGQVADDESPTIEPDKSFDELTAGQRTERYLDAAARDLARAGDKAVVVIGEHLGAEAVAAGIEMNRKLGSLGSLQRFVPELDADLATGATLADLVEQINAGEVNSLLILGGNPAFTAPGDVPLKAAIAKLQDTIYLGEYDDETAEACQWSLPLAHPLESWGDCVDDVGRYGVCQPQILPLLGGRTIPEVLAGMLGERETDTEQIVRRTADEFAQDALSNRQWRQLLHDGYLEGLQQQYEPLSGGQSGAQNQQLSDQTLEPATSIDRNNFEVLFVPADGIYDGRFANNGWLQEMPQSLTKLTWDNAAIMSPATAEALEIRHGLMVALRQPGGATVELPAYVMPGCAPGVVTVPIGYGRTRAGMVGGLENEDVPPVGTDVSPIRVRGAMLTAYEMEARPRYTEYELASTQDHWTIDELGREEAESRSFTLVREGTTALMNKVPEFAEAKGPHVPEVGATGSLWREPMNEIEEEYPQLPQWGMAIDLTKCVGCNACVIACQSENNVPVVGKEQVAKSREMHWLRIDRYFQGDEENADVVQQPMACVHCETAPCESVCPVAATLHTDDGINAMAYNRCIGTRYCSNNCPYKVRRFNFFNYNENVGTGYGIDAFQPSIETANRELQQLVLNPDVTVRGRGVMEKCTYCVQRVEQGKIEARRDGGRAIRDGDVITACQAACPTQAIEFGNLADPDSKVSGKHADVRSYGVLEQLNTKPRTEYLARVRNPHRSLMTRFQLNDLANLETPHHGHHDEHGDEGEPDSHIQDGTHGEANGGASAGGHPPDSQHDRSQPANH